MIDTQASSAFKLQQGDQVDDEQQHDASHTDGLLAEEAPQRIHIRGTALDQVTGRRGVVIGETQPLDMIEQEVAQAAGDAFGRISSQATREIRETALEQRQADEAKRNGNQSACQRIGQRASCNRFGQDAVHEIAQQEEGCRLGRGRDRQGHHRAHVGQAVVRHHLPQTLQAVLVLGSAEVKICGWLC